MSSPFNSWRRSRALSLNYPNNDDDASAVARSPPPSASQTGTSDVRGLSSSFNSTSYREPIRSFIHGSVRDSVAPVDSARSARSVRQDTEELATYLLSDKSARQSSPFLARARSHSSQFRRPPHASDDELNDAEPSNARSSDVIVEVSEPPSPEDTSDRRPDDGPSIIASMLRKSPPDTESMQVPEDDDDGGRAAEAEGDDDDDFDIDQTPQKVPNVQLLPPPVNYDEAEGSSESTPLFQNRPLEQSYGATEDAEDDLDLEGQKSPTRKHWFSGVTTSAERVKTRVSRTIRVVRDPKCWDRKAIWNNVVVAPIACLPAVIVGLLLNILDALSYGMILFPLGSPIFANLGSAGISIFYVSTIVSQVIFSSGSIFKGGVGSELIEVVPFFHSMAGTITDIVGEDDPDAVIATTITSYALSSMVTGTVFYLTGKFRFGYIVGFIPRHILIGCIGGVGWFLVATGFEVSARMDGSLNYDLDTLQRLIQSDTVPLWAIPLALAIILFYCQRKKTSKYFLPLYIIAIPVVFYFFVLSLDELEPDSLRDRGWIFNGPPPGEPWWYFYTLYQFDKVHWGAIAQCIPAMLALTFFGILHVPINVPALALNTGEDHADLDKELKLHGYSNFFSGALGSIQNYLVYANTLFFMRSGGDSRLAGFELAILTFAVMTIGPPLIGFIPVMMVGVLIFDLGFELLLDAIWTPRKKLKRLEYLTVIAIVLIMGIYDFVVGIGVGILLAFVSLIFQTSRVSAVRATYSGDIVGSTVRRNPSQQHYLQQVGGQIFIVKLSGYLFFGTIVSVEDKIRAIISEDSFSKRPIKFVVLDLWQVTGLDYSAGEAFNTVSRLLHSKGVVLVLSGVDHDTELSRDLRAVGLGDEGVEVTLLPDLNSALESCENELLKTFYANQDARELQTARTPNLDVPGKQGTPQPVEVVASSPRRSHLHEAATKSLNQMEVKRSFTRWQSFKEPLRLMLQIFQDLSAKNEDFWFRAVPFFVRREYAAGCVIFRRGESAEGFYLVEAGILRAEYDLPQGWLCESIVAGTTCGELPFFSETSRTATAVVERDAVVWLMDKENWERLQKEEPDVAQELLRISLKLTSERMSAFTSYILTMAG